jgi:hypothetical protein
MALPPLAAAPPPAPGPLVDPLADALLPSLLQASRAKGIVNKNQLNFGFMMLGTSAGGGLRPG